MSKYDFSKVKVKDLDGKLLKDMQVHKGLANAIYVGTNNLDLVEVAIEINKGKAVELEKDEVNSIVQMLRGSNSNIAAFVRKALLDYIEGVKSGKSKT